MTVYAGLYGPEALIEDGARLITAAVIDVFQHGTTTHVSLYQDNARATPLSNPVPGGVDGSTAGRGLDTHGNLSFYVDPGRYDLRIATGIGTRTIQIEVQPDPGEGSAAYQATGVPASVQSLTAPGQTANSKSAVLRGWYAQLAKRDTARANVVIVGDSVTAGQGATTQARRYATRVAARIRQALGLAAGGVGYVAATGNVSTFTWPAVDVGSSNNTDYGVNRNITFLGGAGSVTYTVTGDTADILSFNNAGVFSWAVDAGAATNVPGSAGVEVVTHISLGSAGSHTVTLTWVSGSVFLDGLVVYNGDYASGVQVHDAGHYGWSTAEWTGGGTGPTQWPAAIAALSPGCVVVELGLNDITFPNSASVYQTNLTNLIGYIRAGLSAPLPPIVLLAMPARQNTATTWLPYLAAMYAIAAADANVVVCDLTTRVPGYDADTYSLYYDGVHPNDAGHALIADALTRFLLPG